MNGNAVAVETEKAVFPADDLRKTEEFKVFEEIEIEKQVVVENEKRFEATRFERLKRAIRKRSVNIL